MCLAIPGKVIEIKKSTAIVDYSSEKRNAKTDLVKPKIGDYVLVFKKQVVEIIPENDAKKMMAAWKQVI